MPQVIAARSCANEDRLAPHVAERHGGQKRDLALPKENLIIKILRYSNFAQILLNFVAQQIGLLRQFASGGENRIGNLASLDCGARNLIDVCRHMTICLRRGAGVTRDFLSHRILLTHRARHVIGELVKFDNCRGNSIHGLD